MSEENTDTIGNNPVNGQPKKDWRRDNLATRIDLRMPNEVYDRVVELAIASGEKINPKTNQVRVTATLNKLIEIGIRYFPDNNQTAWRVTRPAVSVAGRPLVGSPAQLPSTVTGESSDTIRADDKYQELSDKYQELSDRIAASTGQLSDETGLEQKYRELSDKYQVLEDKHQKLSDELSDNNQSAQDKYQELSDNVLALIPTDIITNERIEELEAYIQNQIQAVRDELKKLWAIG